MIDHLFAATLTFALLAGGTVAIGSELAGTPRTGPKVQARAPAVVTLPPVTVTGRRSASTAVAGASPAVQSQRLQ